MGMRIAVHCNHIDHGGGGTYSHYLIRGLQHYGDVYITNEHPPFVSYWGNSLDLPTWPGGKPDLFVCIDHRGDIAPMGDKNLRVFFYPFDDMPNTKLYDAAIVMNHFVGRAVVKTTGLYPYVIPIGLDPDNFELGLNYHKENILLVVANFFLENDGHSKHQDLIINWFKQNKLYEDWRLILVGGGQLDFYHHCLDLARDVPGITFTGQMNIEDVAREYVKAKFLIHANGYGRSDPSQTEHFGIVAVEAMLSGCQPLVHRSGGCQEISGVWSWETWSALRSSLSRAINPVYLRKQGEQYSPERMRIALNECLRGVLT